MAINFKDWQKNLHEEQLDETPTTKTKAPYRPGSIDPATGKTREAPKGTMAYDKAQREKNKITAEELELEEALKGDQHKLDADKDGEIEKSDLKKLRSKKDEVVVNNGEQVKENEGCGKKMYREFVEEIQEIVEAKKDDYWDFKDLKDEPKSTTRKIAGKAYGGSAQHDDEDEDDEDAPKKKVDQPKRGRGRPKGSASGARQQGNGQKKSYGGLAIHSLSLPNRNK